MNLNEYQRLAALSAQPTASGVDEKTVAFLGLAGEAGELLSEYKKHLRDGDAHRLFPHRVKEELGDLLWYIGQVSSLFGLEMEDVASANLNKISSRWGSESERSPGLFGPRSFDENFPDEERLPQTIEARMEEIHEGGRLKMRMYIDGAKTGDDITDNAHDKDGYRYHDVFHLSYAMVLGWSPVVRQLLRRKRKSAPQIDEIEDGGRAKAIEEGISAMIFAYAKEHAYFEGIGAVDRDILVMVRKMTAGLEVGERTMKEWESAIVQGFCVWRQMIAGGGGVLIGDYSSRTLSYSPLVPRE